MLALIPIKMKKIHLIFLLTFLFACGTTTKKQYLHSIVSAYIMYLLFISLMIMAANIDGVESQKHLNESFRTIFNVNNYRTFLASSLAYSISMVSFYYLYLYIPGSIFKKTIISSLLCAALDVNAFLLMAFLGKMGSYKLFTLLMSATIKKISCQLILVFPTSYLIEIIRNEKHCSNK